VPVTTGPDGRYALCGVPAGEELVATAEAPERATGQVALEVPRGFVVRDLTLGELPEGTRTLEVRAIGFTMRRVAVDLAAGRAATVDVRMEPTVPLLNPVSVFGTPAKPSARVAEFLQRRRFRTFGRFITGEEIALRRDLDVTGALRGVPGIMLEPNGRLGKTILGRSAMGGGAGRW
jgi:hypothetical protein